jgi:hypothetical protein
MTISSSGLVEWTPDKGSDITNYDNGTTNSPHTITITLTTASGYVLTETYDLTVTGTCVSGNVMSIWSGDQRTSIDSSKSLGNITAYTDNSTTRKNAFENFNYSPSSADIIFGPTAVEGKGSVFFYHQYDNTTHLYFNYFFGVRGSGDPAWNDPKVDIFTSNNTSSDGIIDDDDDGETTRYTSSDQCGQSSTCYKGRYHYKGNTDGAVLGPFTGPDFKIYMILKGSTSTIDGQTLTLDRLESINYFSKDNSTIPLDNSTDFTIGYKASIDCSN